MQEEVESRTVNLAISTTKLSMRTIIHAGMMYLRHRKLVKDLKKNEVPSVKQSVQDLIGQKQGVSSIDIAKTDLRGFEGVARKYGVDYAIRKDASVDPPKYLVFFKSKDADALTARDEAQELAIAERNIASLYDAEKKEEQERQTAEKAQ